MSSYLVALAIGDWEVPGRQRQRYSHSRLRIPGKRQYADFALEAAEFTMKYYDQYFAIKYPYGKLDILGVSDFSAGAMENTGLHDLSRLNFRGSEAILLLSAKAVAQELVAHEIAHQWFGDLVTMKWWDGCLAQRRLSPPGCRSSPWKPGNPNGISRRTQCVQAPGAMDTDSLSSTRAIEAHAETPAQIQELFDNIAYNKAAAVLRMVEGDVGRRHFRKGVNSYLAKYSYANATRRISGMTITQMSHKPVDRIMYGFVKAARRADRYFEDRHATMEKSNVTVTQTALFPRSRPVRSGF